MYKLELFRKHQFKKSFPLRCEFEWGNLHGLFQLISLHLRIMPITVMTVVFVVETKLSSKDKNVKTIHQSAGIEDVDWYVYYQLGDTEKRVQVVFKGQDKDYN